MRSFVRAQDVHVKYKQHRELVERRASRGSSSLGACVQANDEEPNGYHPAKNAHTGTSPRAVATMHADRPQEATSGIGTRGTRQNHLSAQPSEADDIGGGAREAAARGTAGALGEDTSSLRGLTGAVALLDVVQQDTTWQAASHHGSLKGRGVDLLAALHSQRPTSGSSVAGCGAGGVPGPVVDDSRARKKRNSVQLQEPEVKPRVGALAQAPPPDLKQVQGDVQGNSLPCGAEGKEGYADPNRVTRNGFTYPGCERQTFVKVTSLHGNQITPTNAHVPHMVHSAVCCDPATALRAHHNGQVNGTSLHDKVQRAEGLQEPAAATSTVPSMHHTCTHDPAFAAQHVGAHVASAPHMHGTPDHRLRLTAASNSHVAAGQFGGMKVYTTGAPVAAAGAGVAHVRDVSAVPHTAATGAQQVGYITADMQQSPSVHSVVVGAPSGGVGPVGMMGAMPHAASAPSLMSASVGHCSGELKALRNKVNRADGGIGRKLTLEVLQQYFGRGLKEAAESLGMCPTTLKRACRRLGVKRWPRTPELATQVIAEARAAQQQAELQAQAGGAGAMLGDTWQSGGIGDGMAPVDEVDDGVGMDDFEMERPGESMRKPEMMLQPNGQMGEFDDFLNMLEVSE